MTRRLRSSFLVVAASGLLASCAAQSGPDYSAYRQHMPRSILVVPPLNDSVEVNAPYTYLSTITMPLAEAGYYVFPVALIDQMLKDNGLPEPGDMHRVSLAKINEIIGADAVLYVHIEEWGQKYQVLASVTRVSARARLVDVKTGTELWSGKAVANESSGGGDNVIAMLIVAAVEQVLDSVTDQTHELSRRANLQMVLDSRNGLLAGPHSPRHAQDSRGR